MKGHQTLAEFNSMTDMSCQFPIEDSQASERSGKAIVAKLTLQFRPENGWEWLLNESRVRTF